MQGGFWLLRSRTLTLRSNESQIFFGNKESHSLERGAMEDDHWSFGPARTSGGITSDLPVATVPAEARTPIPAQRARKGGGPRAPAGDAPAPDHADFYRWQALAPQAAE